VKELKGLDHKLFASAPPSAMATMLESLRYSFLCTFRTPKSSQPLCTHAIARTQTGRHACMHACMHIFDAASGPECDSSSVLHISLPTMFESPPNDVIIFDAVFLLTLSQAETWQRCTVPGRYWVRYPEPGAVASEPAATSKC